MYDQTQNYQATVATYELTSTFRKYLSSKDQLVVARPHDIAKQMGLGYLLQSPFVHAVGLGYVNKLIL